MHTFEEQAICHAIYYVCIRVYVHAVHDTESLTFSTDYRVENLHIAVQRMSVRTISGFRAEQLTDSVWNSADVICSCTDLLHLFIFTEIARITRSTGKDYLLLQ